MGKKLKNESLAQVIDLCPIVVHLPVKELYIRYDKEADVLYVQFQRPANIYTSDISDDGVIIEHDRSGNVVGITILSASTRGSQSKLGAGRREQRPMD
jgi:uncharacterized protein YuzE